MIYEVAFTESALNDLELAKEFYSRISIELGDYCINSILNDVARLAFFAGIHKKQFDYYRMLTKNFPFSVYYQMFDQQVIIAAVLDNRQHPYIAMDRLSF